VARLGLRWGGVTPATLEHAISLGLHSVAARAVLWEMPCVEPEAAETTVAWAIWLAAFSAVVAALTVLHYRDTEPQGEIRWIVLGLAVLAGSGIVHWWVIRTQRQML